MMRSSPGSDSDVDAVLAGAKVIRPLPATVRARALARARAGMATAAKAGFEPTLRTPRRRGAVIALAASLAIAVVAATAVAALGIQAARRKASAAPSGLHTAAPPVPVAVLPPPTVATAPAVEQPTLDEQLPSTPKPQRAPHPTTAQESYAAELELLSRAQVTYAGRDFASALGLVAEHARRFPNGRLTEEREALRVRSLTGAGRTEEAQRAASAFAERFPRSILLPRPGRALH